MNKSSFQASLQQVQPQDAASVLGISCQLFRVGRAFLHSRIRMRRLHETSPITPIACSLLPSVLPYPAPVK